MSSPRSTAYWALALTVLLHVLLALVFLRGGQHLTVAAAPGPALQVRLVAEPAQARAGHANAEESAIAPPEPLAPPPEPVRNELHYYFPEELDRQLIVLKDDTGQADVRLREPVIMHLFVDVEGKVAAISFEGDPPAAVQDQLRALFITMEFVPGQLHGKAVPSRIKIAIAAEPVAEAGSEVR